MTYKLYCHRKVPNIAYGDPITQAELSKSAKNARAKRPASNEVN